MTDKFIKMVYLTGIADFFKYKKKCPVYWRGKDEEAVWQAGYDYAVDQQGVR